MNLESIPDDYIDGSSKSGAAQALPDDHSLILLIARGDGEALEELYRRFSVILFNFLLRLVGDTAAAEDLLQDVFLSVWKGAGRFRSASSVKTWLFAITYNQAVSWLRKRRDAPMSGIDSRVVEPGAEIAALQNLQDQAVRKALQSLSPNHRAVIELAFYFDCTYAEIAEIMGCPVGTVKSRMSHARQQLLAALLVDGQVGKDNE